MAADQTKYLDLIRRFPLRPLRCQRDLNRAVQVIDSLIDRSSLSRAEKDYLDVLADLVAAYEDDVFPESPVSDDRMLRHLIEANEVTQTAVAQATGITPATISAVLKGTRQLTREQIGRLAAYFHVEPGIFQFGVGGPPAAKVRPVRWVQPNRGVAPLVE